MPSANTTTGAAADETETAESSPIDSTEAPGATAGVTEQSDAAAVDVTGSAVDVTPSGDATSSSSAFDQADAAQPETESGGPSAASTDVEDADAEDGSPDDSALEPDDETIEMPVGAVTEQNGSMDMMTEDSAIPSETQGAPVVNESAVPSAGCGQPWNPDDVELDERFNSPTRQAAWREMTINAVQREYLVTVPVDYDANKPYALIFAFHGLGGDRDQLRGYMNIETPADSEAIVIYPSGLPARGGSTGWELDEPSDDLTFVDGLLESYAAELCIDHSRVFATGHSYGGCMSNSVGCYRGDVFRAIAPVAGCGPFAWNLECVGQVASMVVHSPYDAVEDFSSGVNACTRSLQANGCEDPEGCGCYWEESLGSADDECLHEAHQAYTSEVDIEVSDRDEKPPALREYLNCDAGYPVVAVDYWRREQRDADAPGERWHNPPPWAPALIWEFFASLPSVE